MTTGNIYWVLTVYSVLFEDFTGVYTSAMWEGHYFTDEETEARFAHWPRVTGQGDGGASIRFRAAWLQSHSLIHTRWARDPAAGGTLWAKEEAGVDRERVEGEVSEAYLKGLQCKSEAFGLHGKKVIEKQWTEQENDMVTQHPGSMALTVNAGCAVGHLLWLESCDCPGLPLWLRW